MALRFILTALFVLLLLRKGFTSYPGYLAWPMFSRLAGAEFRCTYRGPGGQASSFNQWEYLPNLETGMSELGLASFLDYLRTVRGLDLNGTVILRDEYGTRHLTVDGTRVVD